MNQNVADFTKGDLLVHFWEYQCNAVVYNELLGPSPESHEGGFLYPPVNSTWPPPDVGLVGSANQYATFNYTWPLPWEVDYPSAKGYLRRGLRGLYTDSSASPAYCLSRHQRPECCLSGM